MASIGKRIVMIVQLGEWLCGKMVDVKMIFTANETQLQRSLENITEVIRPVDRETIIKSVEFG